MFLKISKKSEYTRILLANNLYFCKVNIDYKSMCESHSALTVSKILLKINIIIIYVMLYNSR